jgi:hypothetical protein
VGEQRLIASKHIASYIARAMPVNRAMRSFRRMENVVYRSMLASEKSIAVHWSSVVDELGLMD